MVPTKSKGRRFGRNDLLTLLWLLKRKEKEGTKT